MKPEVVTIYVMKAYKGKGVVNFTPPPLNPREIIPILNEQKIGRTPDPVSICVCRSPCRASNVTLQLITNH
jgi:hypothetical protein